MCCQMPHGDLLFEPGTILHIGYQRQLDHVVIRDAVHQARTEGLAEALKDLSEAGQVLVGYVTFDEESMPEGPLCLTAGEVYLTIASCRGLDAETCYSRRPRWSSAGGRERASAGV